MPSKSKTVAPKICHYLHKQHSNDFNIVFSSFALLFLLLQSICLPNDPSIYLLWIKFYELHTNSDKLCCWFFFLLKLKICHFFLLKFRFILNSHDTISFRSILGNFIIWMHLYHWEEDKKKCSNSNKWAYLCAHLLPQIIHLSCESTAVQSLCIFHGLFVELHLLRAHV